MELLIDDVEELLDAFQAHVWDDEPAAYLAFRGLTHATIDRFGLGFTGGWGDLGALGDYRCCLVFPYEDGLGRLRKLRYRPIRPDWTGPKYLDLKNAEPHLYAPRALDNPIVYVAEGEIDTMTLWQLGLRAVGMPGAAMFREHWKYLFREPHVERVILVLDPDASGRQAAVRVKHWVSDVCEDVRIVGLPKGLDVNDTLRKYGAETLKEALDV